MTRPLALVLALACARIASAEPTVLEVGGGRIELDVEDGDGPPRDAIVDWVRRGAAAVSAFYGRFPVARVRIVVGRMSGRGVTGTTWGGRLIRMRVGTAAPAALLAHDWTMTHELFHLGFPDLDDRYHWMEEGMATYFEPIARARAGDLAAERLWRELFDGLPNGLPHDGDRGLDQTPTWGRTYWGGALFWCLADVAIRERTGNRRSADDVLRAILAAGGDGSEHWSIERVVEVGDRATGTRVLAELHERMGTHPAPVDLDDLAARLTPALRASIVGRPDRERVTGRHSARRGGGSP